jgi:hypothetical protein
VNWLRTAAWTVFALDLVILAQSGYAALTGGGGGPTGQTLLRAFSMLMASWLLGVGIVLIVGSWRRSALGLWVSLVFAALPLLWVGAGMLGLWQ